MQGVKIAKEPRGSAGAPLAAPNLSCIPACLDLSLHPPFFVESAFPQALLEPNNAAGAAWPFEPPAQAGGHVPYPWHGPE